DVRPRPDEGGGRGAARLQARRPHRAGIVDPGRVPRRPVPGRGRVRATRSRHSIASPVGHRGRLGELFADAAAAEHSVGHFSFRYRSPEHMVEVFRAFYGPTHKAFAALDTGRQAALEADML